MEELITFRSGNLRIEGLFNHNNSDMGMIVTHPHPLMGGSMFNNVVEAIVAAFDACNYSTLRFNFRGVGNSEGIHGNGIGEQQDLMAGRDFLERKGCNKIGLVGYSFGSWVNANILKGHATFYPVIMVSPPLKLFSFNIQDLAGKINLIISGKDDPYSSYDELTETSSHLRGKLTIMDGTDHFYIGKEGGLKNIIIEFLDKASNEKYKNN